MKRKHFLSIGAGLTVGGLLGKNAISMAPSSSATNGQLPEFINHGLKGPTQNRTSDQALFDSINPEVQDAEKDGPYWDFIRSQFPINGNITFLNNGTMGITPYPVLEALNKSFHNIAENASYPMHDGSFEDELALVLGCKSSEIAITKNVSEGVNLACRAIDLKKGDEVVITMHEHVGGCTAWLYRAQTEGIVLKIAALASTAAETFENIKAATTKKTKVLALPHIPCTIGQVLPVKDICLWAKSQNIITAIDGAHPLGMLQINLKDMGCDYYSGCFHKWLLGPIGTGFFYASESILNKSKIYHVAAYSIDKFDMSTVPPSMGELVPKTSRYSYGTFPGPLYDGVKAALKFYNTIGPTLVEKRVKFLSGALMGELMMINDMANTPTGNQAGSSDGKGVPLMWKMHPHEGPILEILTPMEDISRGAQVGFRINATMKDGANISKNANGTISIGTAGAQTPSQRFCDFARKNGIILRYVAENNIHCVRVSTHYYNNTKDIKKFIGVLIEFLQKDGWL